MGIEYENSIFKITLISLSYTPYPTDETKGEHKNLLRDKRRLGEFSTP